MLAVDKLLFYNIELDVLYMGKGYMGICQILKYYGYKQKLDELFKDKIDLSDTGNAEEKNRAINITHGNNE